MHYKQYNKKKYIHKIICVFRYIFCFYIIIFYIITQVIENDRFENMVEIVNMSQWKCALTMTAMVKTSAQSEPFQVSKGNEICFILFFCNCP